MKHTYICKDRHARNGLKNKLANSNQEKLIKISSFIWKNSVVNDTSFRMQSKTIVAAYVQVLGLNRVQFSLVRQMTRGTDNRKLNQNYNYASFPNTNLLKQLNLCSPYNYAVIFFSFFLRHLLCLALRIFLLFFPLLCIIILLSLFCIFALNISTKIGIFTLILYSWP